jgi:hypothetical protein
MWIGSIRFRVKTKDAPHAGTDSLVTAKLKRDGHDIEEFALDYPLENDLERGAVRNYDYIGPTRLPRNNDKTPELPPGIGETPMPYPSYGVEFSHGIQGHFTLRLEIHDDDAWTRDRVELFVREIRLKPTSIDTLEWVEDTDWTSVAVWNRDVTMSTDSSEGLSIWDLTF